MQQSDDEPNFVIIPAAGSLVGDIPSLHGLPAVEVNKIVARMTRERGARRKEAFLPLVKAYVEAEYQRVQAALNTHYGNLCKDCGGTGDHESRTVDCPACFGTGHTSSAPPPDPPELEVDFDSLGDRFA